MGQYVVLFFQILLVIFIFGLQILQEQALIKVPGIGPHSSPESKHFIGLFEQRRKKAATYAIVIGALSKKRPQTS